MSQGNRIFDELGKLMNSAAGAADGVRREVETAVKSQLERLIADMDLVKREDFDALRELVQAQSAELKAMKAELKSGKPKVAAAAAAKPRAASAPVGGKAKPKAAAKPATKAATKPATKASAKAK